MELPDYKPNSNKYKSQQANTNPERKMEKIVTGKTTTKKQSTGKKLLNQFVDDVVKEILIPSAKETIFNMVTTATGITLGVENPRGRQNSFFGNGNRNTPYYKYSGPNQQSYRRGDVYDYDNIVFDQRLDAERVLQALREEVNEYGSVSVGQLFSLAGENTRSTDYDYGWTSLTPRNSGTVRNQSGGYSIDLPRAVPIN